jgi:putative membrane-bound dehydrogenase-like protein
MNVSPTRVRRALAQFVLCLSACSLGAQGPRRPDGPLSPDETLATFDLEPGHRIELAAAEPLISDPVAIAFDDRGRLYVVENRGYPGPLEGGPQPPPQGVIALLEDTNADGRFDTRTDFADKLTYPNGILPWKGGVFVTCAPDLLYLKDTNGDGVADERRVVLTGFSTSRTPQIRFSHPTLGIDNWVYLTSGLNGGKVTAPDHPDRAPVVFTTSDSRFNPFTFAFELTGGQSQFGLTFDDFGRRFTCANRNPVWHVVLDPRYLQRNPHLAFSDTVQEVSAVGAQAAVWPISADTTTASFHPTLMSTPHAGTFTAASGVHIHRGDALPEADRNSIFVCESAQNLVQRQILSASGVTFTSRPAQVGRDFLASRDQWFRPVFAANGPDGALYIVDMYRKNIDHPQYVPEESRGLLDFEAGKGRGRIYRVAARNWTRDRQPIDLGRRGAEELARTLEHPNAWWRETAQRLIVERGDRAAEPFVRKIAADGRSPAARVHALWTLDGLKALEPASIVKALRDSYPAVRENGARLAESRLSSSQDLLAELVRLADDVDERVRFQVALALGESADARALQALAAIARRDGTRSWMRAAILSSIRDRANEFLQAFVAQPAASPAVKAALLQDLGQVFGAGQTTDRCLDLILQITEPADDFGWQPAALAGIARGLRSRAAGGASGSALMMLVSSGSPKAVAARARLTETLARSAGLARDDKTPGDQRLAAIELLGHADYSSAGETLLGLLAPQHPSEIQIAAVRALSQLSDRAAAAALVDRERWLAFTPEVRDTVLSVLLADEDHALVLLEALEKGSIPPGSLGPSRRNRLRNHRNASIRDRAATLFASVEAGNRMQVYERLRAPVLAKTGNAANGRQMFAIHCASCHSFHGIGGRLGPDLSGIRNQPADAILLHALVPDYEIAPGYQAYTVETRDGRTFVGRLESEAPNSLTLRDASLQSHVVLRSQVVSITASPASLMPSELERRMSEQELADLIGYLKQGGRH